MNADEQTLRALRAWYAALHGINLRDAEAIQEWYAKGAEIIAEIDPDRSTDFEKHDQY